MDANELLAKVSKRFSLKDVQDNQVETVSVISIEELDSLIATAVQQQASKQMAELSAGAGDGGLEQAAAEAALEAEAKALEAKAEAEQRAATAEARVAQLEAQVAELEENTGSPEDAAKLEELEKKVAELESAEQAAKDKASELETKLADLTKELEEAKKKAAEAAEEEVDAGGEVTDSDRSQAKRIAEAFLEDVFSDDEDKTNNAIKAGTFRDDFAAELKRAHRKYIKRIKAHVRADQDFWEDTISKFLLKEW